MSSPTFKYETIGNSRFLIVTIADAAAIAHDQIQTLTNNEIPNILSMHKSVRNDAVSLNYNVASKNALSQAINGTRMSKQGFLELINGILSVYSTLTDYQLVHSGIILDNEYIFVETDSYKPYFIYLPLSNMNGVIKTNLQDFLLGFILHSKVEITNDNFIQVLIETMNSPSFSMDELSKTINAYINDGRAHIHASRMPSPSSVLDLSDPEMENLDTVEEAETEISYTSEIFGAHLEYFDNGLINRIKLNKPVVIIGRMKSQVDYALRDSRIGRIHAEFISDNGQYYVKDNNSVNGTYINGSKQRITSNTLHQIQNGDRITLACIELQFRC